MVRLGIDELEEERGITAYGLAVDTGIEDLAGNHIGAAFDIDIFEKVSRTIERNSISIPFTVR